MAELATTTIAPWTRSPKLYAVVASALLFSFVCFRYITSFWLNVPYYDEWKIVPLIAKFVDGNATFADLVEQDPKVGGHRIILTRLVELTSTKLFHYDTRFTMGLGLICLVAIAAILLWHYRRPIAGAPIVSLLVWPPMFAVLFSLHSWENLLAPWAVNTPACMLFFLAAIVLLLEASTRRLVLALCFAVACSITFTHGLFVWPMGAAVLIARRRKSYAIVWGGVAAAFLAVFFHGFTSFKGAGKGDLSAQVGRLLAVVGSPLSLDNGYISGSTPTSTSSLLNAQIAGAVLLVLLVGLATLLLAKRRVLSHLLPIAVILYGLALSAMIAVGRADLPAEQALSSRYVQAVAALYIGALLLLFELLLTVRPVVLQAIAIVLSGAVINASLVAAIQEMKVGPHRRAWCEHWREVVRNFRTATDADLANPHLTPDEIRETAQLLADRYLGPFKL